MNRSRSSDWVPLLLSAILIALATLVPLGATAPRFHWRIEIPDVLVNLGLYFPLGFLLARRGWRVGSVATVAGLASGLIELLQGSLIAGRRGSPIDVVINIAGAALGAAAFEVAERVLASRRPGVRGILSLLLGLPIVAWLGSGFLLMPYAPKVPSWYSLWAHQFLDTEPFRGTLLEVRLQGREVPDGVTTGVSALRADARAHGLRFDITLLSDGSTWGVTQLASIGDLRDGTVIGIEQVGDDLMLYWASRGSSLGLRPPRMTFARAGKAQRGERLVLHAAVTRSRVELRVTGAGWTRSERRSLTPLTGWRNWIPSRELPAPQQRCFDLVWTLALIGYTLVAVRVLRTRRL